MTDHDPECPQPAPMPGEMSCPGCDLIARVRADANLAALDAFRNERRHAEAVAAKLVEVICEMHGSPAHQLMLRGLDAMYADLSADRDAARAEVAALREQMSGMYQAETFTDTDGYPSIRVIKATERVGENEWAMIIRREVLADVRAKVEALPDVGDESDPRWSRVYRESVLRLIEEADRG